MKSHLWACGPQHITLVYTSSVYSCLMLVGLQWLFEYIVMEVKAWMSDHIPVFYMDMIPYKCPYPHAGLAHFS